MVKKLNLTPEELIAHKKEVNKRAYLKARELGKEWASSEKSLNRWRSLPYEERSSRQKAANAKRRAAYPNESKDSMIAWRRIHGEEERQKEHKKRWANKQLSVEYMGGHCKKCGLTFHMDVYEFHHADRDEKDSTVASLMGRKFEGIKEELDKCVLLCANCHRIEHAELYRDKNSSDEAKMDIFAKRKARRRKRYLAERASIGKSVGTFRRNDKRNSISIAEIKSDQEYRSRNKKLAIEYLGGKCSMCNGVFHPEAYDFHHIDASTKKISVAKWLVRKFARIIPELDKCVLLCANCHRLTHAEYNP